MALILPDVSNSILQLYALGFPDGNSIVHLDKSKPINGSLAGQVFRSGKPSVRSLKPYTTPALKIDSCTEQR